MSGAENVPVLSNRHLLRHISSFASHASFPRNRRTGTGLLLEKFPEFEALIRSYRIC